MRHLDVGWERVERIAACGAWLRVFVLRDPDRSQATNAHHRVDCARCLAALDLMLDAGLAVIKKRSATASSFRLDVVVDERAFPYAGPCIHDMEYGSDSPVVCRRCGAGRDEVERERRRVCQHRYVRAVSRVTRPPPSWREFNEPVRPERHDPLIEQSIECAECGADVTGARRQANVILPRTVLNADWPAIRR